MNSESNILRSVTFATSGLPIIREIAKKFTQEVLQYYFRQNGNWYFFIVFYY